MQVSVSVILDSKPAYGRATTEILLTYNEDLVKHELFDAFTAAVQKAQQSTPQSVVDVQIHKG